MRCTACGYNAEDGVEFCPNCGEYLGKNQRNNNQFYNEPKVDDQAKKGSEPNGESGGFNTNSNPEPINFDIPMNQSYNTEPVRPMRWYKFLIYFAFFAGAVLNISTGFQYLTGTIYGETADLVYEVFPSLKPLDALMGLACFALAVFNIVTRNSLAKFKANALTLMTAMYVSSMVINVVYSIIAAGIIEIGVPVGEIIGTCLGSAIMLVINYVYLKNRKYMFVN